MTASLRRAAFGVSLPLVSSPASSAVSQCSLPIADRTCAKCAECKGQLTLLNFAQLKGTLYCKPHFIELFKREEAVHNTASSL
jgi:hypothetical protein